MKNIIPLELIEKRIYLVRGQKVMLDGTSPGFMRSKPAR